MASISGPRTGWSSHQVKRIFQELKRGNKDYCKVAKLCTASGCRSGFRVDNSTGKVSECPVCQGWGVLRIK